LTIQTKDLAEMQGKDKLCPSLKHLLNKMPVAMEFAKREPEMSQNCFLESNILWRGITRHVDQHTVEVTPKALNK
jgi:hypothetical protein